ncbi:MAG: GTP pyrophosphokinase [Lachnospiraceae bacterium]|nr:GTP pyrophosphokinase [Lachnospiraceae bacterium]
MKRKNRDECLSNLIQDYEDAHVAEICAEMIRTVRPYLERIRTEMTEKYNRQVVQYITSRVKSPESILNKLIRKRRSQTMEKALETFHDLAGIRMVCTFQDDVYRVVKAIRKVPVLNVIKVKDYIAHPKPSGYRSIHMIAEVPDCPGDILLEIQVCSAAMNYWAMLDHQLSYKNSKVNSAKLENMEKELKSYAMDIANIDKKFLKIRKEIEKL